MLIEKKRVPLTNSVIVSLITISVLHRSFLHLNVKGTQLSNLSSLIDNGKFKVASQGNVLGL